MNWHIFILAVFAMIIQNQYFGWNLTPKSDVELITDCIIIAIAAMAFIGKKQ